MMTFIIFDGLPYLFKDDVTYAVRWDDQGFTIGDPVDLPGPHTEVYSELSVKAKCETLNSISRTEKPKVQKSRRSRKKAV